MVSLIPPDDLVPQPLEFVTRQGHPTRSPGGRHLANGLLTDQACVFHRNVEISSRYAWIYRFLPAYFKWAGTAAFASHHVRLALFPFRLDKDRTGYVNIPRGRVKSALLISDVDTIRNQQCHLRRHLLGASRVRHRRRRDRSGARSLGSRSPTMRPSSPASRRSTGPPCRGGRGPRPQTLDGGLRTSSGRAMSSSWSTSSAPWCNPTSIDSRVHSHGSSRWARQRTSRCVGSGGEVPYFTSFYTYSLTRGGPLVRTRPPTWPRITRFEDRWRWLVASIIPRFRTIRRRRASRRQEPAAHLR